MKEFKEFEKSGIVRKQTPNKERAAALIVEAVNKKEYLDVIIKKIPKDSWNANVIVDQCYDVLMELIRAKMFFDGYNSGNSHEAEVAYLQILKFDDLDIRTMDEIRYYRNGTKYYGTMLNMEYAEKIIDFLNKIYPRLIKMLNG